MGNHPLTLKQFEKHWKITGVPAKKRGNSLNVYMLRKSKAFACTKGVESRFSPFGNPHRARLAGTAGKIILFLGMILFLCNSIYAAKEVIVITGKVVIDKPTLYKNVTLDLNKGSFLIINNASLEIENCVVNGSITDDNSFLIQVSQGRLSLKHNSFNVSSVSLPGNPSNPTIYDLIRVIEGQIQIIGNTFVVDKSYTTGWIVTSAAHTSNFNISNNNINNFHGGILLRNTSEASIVNNTFKNVSSGAIYIINSDNSIINKNTILFSGNNNLGDGIDIIQSDQILLSHNYILSGSCYSILILKSQNITLNSNKIIGGITYAISIMTSLGITNGYDIYLKQFLSKMNISLNEDSNNQNIILSDNYIAQNRYGLTASNVDGLVVKNNVFIQKFSSNKERRFWTDNKILFQNVMNITWVNNHYKEAFSQNEYEDNEKSLKFVIFPLFDGIDL